MKTAIIVALFAQTALCVESPVERDLAKLRSDRDRAVAAATDPIQRKYKSQLEQLLRRAMRNEDLGAAVKIKEAIEAIPASVLLGKPHPTTSQELKDFLHGTTWEISNGDPTAVSIYTLTFNRNGTFKHSDGREGAYEVSGPSAFKMWGHDPATLNAGFNAFRASGSATAYYGKLKID
jgi:hypothetical protein